MPSLIDIAAPKLPTEAFKDALAAGARVRRRETILYEGVIPTLEHLRACDIPVVAFTESNAYWTEWRIRKTGLDGLLTTLYSAPDHSFPEGVTRLSLRANTADRYGLRLTEHRTTPDGYRKPDPRILRDILQDFDVLPHQAIYIGDSLMKDVAMANAVGVPSVYARYGAATARSEYELLRRVTHWSDAEVERERRIAENDPPQPRYTLNNFSELLDVCGV